MDMWNKPNCVVCQIKSSIRPCLFSCGSLAAGWAAVGLEPTWLRSTCTFAGSATVFLSFSKLQSSLPVASLNMMWSGFDVAPRLTPEVFCVCRQLTTSGVLTWVCRALCKNTQKPLSVVVLPLLICVLVTTAKQQQLALERRVECLAQNSQSDSRKMIRNQRKEGKKCACVVKQHEI